MPRVAKTTSSHWLKVRSKRNKEIPNPSPQFAQCLRTWPQQRPLPPPKPAILLNTWGDTPDLAYMKRLQATGFEVDAIAHHELTWERLKNYNVLLLVDTYFRPRCYLVFAPVVKYRLTRTA